MKKAYTIIFSHIFINDLNHYVEIIGNTLHAPVAAQVLKDEIDAAILEIKKKPLEYPIVKDKYLAALGFRYSQAAKNCMIFFIVEGKVIKILRFLDKEAAAGKTVRL